MATCVVGLFRRTSELVRVPVLGNENENQSVHDLLGFNA